MSIVIIGGNECMERLYKDTCKKYGHRAKVFTKFNSSDVDKKWGRLTFMFYLLIRFLMEWYVVPYALLKNVVPL